MIDLVAFAVQALTTAREEGNSEAEAQIWKDIHTEARDEFPEIEKKIKEVLN